jgi:hypothetical protein
MKKITTLSLTILLLVITNLTAADLSFNGSVRNYTGVLPTQEFEYAIMQETFDLSIEYYINNSAVLINPYMNYDLDEELTIDLREAYIDLYLEDADLRIGRQQIIWGKADGVFITDVVSPKNLENFLIPDFNEIRLGVTALKADYYMDDATYELIWIPVFTPNTMPDSTSIWNSKGIVFGDTDSDIDPSFENSEIFGRYSKYTPKIDFELMGGYMWYDEPTLKNGSFTHESCEILGGSLSSNIDDFIIRSEGAWYIFSPDLEMDYLHYMAGIDYKFKGWNLSTQFIQKVYLRDISTALNRWNTTVTFMANKEFLENTLMLEFFAYLEFDDFNALIKPKITYDLSDDVDILFGANLFLGDSGTFGQFDNNDMIYSKIKLSF